MAIIDDLLRFSRIEAGHFPLTHADFALTELSNFIRNEGELLAGETGTTFEFQAEPQDRIVHSDLQALRQILLNLINNAFKFAAGKLVRVDISLPTPAQLVFHVEDSGRGIPKEDQEQVFEPFFQVSRGARRVFGGTGLGLAVVQRLVASLQGTISLEDRPGGGTIFRVRLPVGPPTGDAGADSSVDLDVHGN